MDPAVKKAILVVVGMQVVKIAILKSIGHAAKKQAEKSDKFRALKLQ